MVETGPTFLANASLPHAYWDDALLTASFLINRLPSPITTNKFPFEILYKQKLDYHFLKTFGCACWSHLRPLNSHKFDYPSKLCVFLGYSLNYEGYKCLNPSNGRIYFYRNVVFDENLFPFSQHIAFVSYKSDSPTKTLPSNIRLSHVLSSTNILPSNSTGIQVGQNTSQPRMTKNSTPMTENLAHLTESSALVLPSSVITSIPRSIQSSVSQYIMRTTSQSNIMKSKNFFLWCGQIPTPKGHDNPSLKHWAHIFFINL